MNLKIANLYSMMHIKEPFSLAELKKKFTFKPQAKTRVITIRGITTTFTIFKTGTITGKGSKDFILLQQDFLWLESLLSGFGLKLTSYRVANIVSIAKVSNKKLSLIELAKHMPDSSYDPTPPITMPRAILYKPNGSRALLIYGTGTAVLTGFKTMIDSKEVAEETEKLITGILREYPEATEEI